jgi:hypothetical protein
MPSTAAVSSWLNQTFSNKWVQYGAAACIILVVLHLAREFSKEIAE